MEPYQKPFESQDKLHPLVTHHLPTLILFPYILTSLSNTTVLLETRAVYPLINCVFLGRRCIMTGVFITLLGTSYIIGHFVLHYRSRNYIIRQLLHYRLVQGCGLSTSLVGTARGICLHSRWINGRHFSIAIITTFRQRTSLTSSTCSGQAVRLVASVLFHGIIIACGVSIGFGIIPRASLIIFASPVLDQLPYYIFD